MLVMWEKNEINVKKLGEILYLDSGTLTPVLKKLEAKEYIIRKRSENDERNLIISVTSKGLKLKKEAKSVPDEVSKCVNLNKDEAKELYKLLYKILKYLNNN